jgi:hypothetical protein
VGTKGRSASPVHLRHHRTYDAGETVRELTMTSI